MSKRKFMSVMVAALAAIVLLSAAEARATVLLWDDFDDETLELNYNDFAYWDVSGGTVDLIGAGGGFDFLPGNGRYVDLDGSTTDSGILESKTSFEFLAGMTYRLSFNLAGSQRRNETNTVYVKVKGGDLVNESIELASTAGFALFSFDFTPGTTMFGTISFENIGGDNVGLLLDEVHLEKVPEPASLALFGLGLLGLGVLRRRKRI